MRDPAVEHILLHTRRQFFGRCACGIGTAALGALLGPSLSAQVRGASVHAAPQHPPKAKRIVYLFQSGGPSHLDLFDYKPAVQASHGAELPPSVRGNQRLTTMTSGQQQFPVVASKFAFSQHGPGRAWFSEIIPHMASVAGEMCVVNSLTTEAINHDPATTLITTGAQLAGRPSMGAWLSYGLGSENDDLPAFCVLISKGNPRVNMQPLYPRIWGAGFLPAEHQGVNLRSSGDPVLYIKDPPGVDAATRRRMLDGIARINEQHYADFGDPEIVTRIAQYEMAYRMQTSVPELVDFSDEPQHVIDMYGPDVRRPGSYAANCLLARRLAERGVRFVQLFHRGWDQHAELPRDISTQAQDTDQPSAALVRDLKQRGMLEDTLVVWGGEFGRTVYSQGSLQKDTYGRDHHGRCYTVWMAGGGVRAGTVYGKTDDFGYNVAQDPVAIHDFNATMLHLMGIDHLKLTYPYQGRDFRLTDVYGNVLPGLIA